MSDKDKIGLKAEFDLGDFDGNVDAYNKAVDQMADRTDDAGSAMESAFSSLGKAWDKLGSGINVGKEVIVGALRSVGDLAVGVLGAAASAMSSYAADSFAGAIEAQAGLDRLYGSIENLGEASPITADQALELADQFKNLAGGSDDAVLAAQDVLLRFNEIGADVFPRVLEQSADLATVFGTDMAGGANILGKVLQDLSVDGVGSLGRLKAAGVTLTEQQEEQILAMVEAGNVAGAQEAVLDALAATTGGKAADAAESLAGRWAIFQESVADAGEGVALALLPGLESLADAVLPKVIGLVDTLAPILTDIAAGAGAFIAAFAEGDVGGAFDALGEFESFQQIFDALGVDIYEVGGAVEGIVQILGQFFETITGQTDPTERFLGIWEDVADVFGPDAANLVTAFTHTVYNVITGVQSFGQEVGANLPIIQQAFADAWSAIGPALTELWTVIATEVMPTIASLTGDTSAQLPTVRQVFEAVSVAVVFAARTFADFLTDYAIPAIRSVVDWTEANWPTIQATIDTVMTAAGDVIETVLGGVQTFWAEWGDEIKLVTDAIFENVGIIFDAFSKAFQGDWRGFGETLREAWDNAWEAIGKVVDSGIKAIQEIDWGAVGKGIVDGIAGGISAFGGRIAEAARSAAEAALEAAKGLLGIQSPSSVFWDDVGVPIGEGLAGGMLSTAGLIDNAASALADGALRGAEGRLTRIVDIVDDLPEIMPNPIDTPISEDWRRAEPSAPSDFASSLTDFLASVSMGLFAGTFDDYLSSLGWSDRAYRGPGDMIDAPLPTMPQAPIMFGLPFERYPQPPAQENHWHYSPVYGGPPRAVDENFELMRIMGSR